MINDQESNSKLCCVNKSQSWFSIYFLFLDNSVQPTVLEDGSDCSRGWLICYMWQTQVENEHYSTVSGLIRLVVSLECFIEITPDFLCPFMND